MQQCRTPSEDYWSFLNDVNLLDFQAEERPISKHVPYKCPIVPCGRLISPSCCLRHFSLDHTKIDIADIYHNRAYVMPLLPWKMKLGEVNCLAVLKVYQQGDFTLSDTSQSESDEERSSDFTTCSTMVAKFQYGPDYLREGPECFLLVWSSCLFMGVDTFVRIEARHPIKKRLNSILYQGPVKSIYSSQKPKDVYRSGDCLALSPGLFRNLTDREQGIEIVVSYYEP